MKKDGGINENSINDLIRYAEDDSDNTPDTEQTEDDFGKETVHETTTEVPPEDDFDFDTDDDDLPDDEPYEIDIVLEDKDKPKGTRKGAITGIIIGLIAVIAFISVDSGAIGTYKNNFAKNFSNIFKNFKSEKQVSVTEPTFAPAEVRYNTDVTGNAIISLEGATDTEFVPYKDGILLASMNHISYIDKTGAVVWEQDTIIVDPILKAAGNYILLAERGRSKICLYNDKKLVYETDDPDAITAAKVSSNGDVIVITDKASYKGGISVYNRSGAQIFSWASGSDTVVSADISSASRRVAVALLNTDTSVKSTIQLFNVNETSSYAKTDVDNTVIFDVEFTGNTLSAFGDNRIIGLSSAGKLLYDSTFESVRLTHSAIDDNGNKLLSFDNGNTPMLSLYSEKGYLKDSASLTGVAGFIGVRGKNILYNIGRDVYFGKINSKNMTRYTATMDIRNLYVISNDAFVIVYSNSIEIVTV